MNKDKLSIRDIHGGDIVRLKNGATVTVDDIRAEHIIVASDEWYHIDNVVEIIKRFGDK